MRIIIRRATKLSVGLLDIANRGLWNSLDVIRPVQFHLYLSRFTRSLIEPFMHKTVSFSSPSSCIIEPGVNSPYIKYATPIRIAELELLVGSIF